MIKWMICFAIFSVSFADKPLQGIVFLSDSGKVLCSPQEPFSGVVSDGVALFDKNPSFLRKIEQQYLGFVPSESLFSSIKQDICCFYDEKNQPFVSVSVPKQNLSSGVLQVIVNEAKLGEIRVSGNRYFGGAALSKYIQTQQGSPIVMQDVVEDIAWMNQNPFRRTDAVFVPGSKPGTADLELVTADRWPYRFYMGADNTGTISTERDRLFFGFDFGKTVIADSQVAYQFSCSPNWNRFFAHTASARIPCPWRHVAIFYGGYAQVEPSLDMKDASEKGKSWQVDGRYRIPVYKNSSLMQEVVIGYDFKETQDWVKDHNHQIFKAVADINQFMLGYELGYQTKDLKTTFVIEGYANPSGITTKNKTKDYEHLRLGAKATYGYLKFAHSLAKKIPYGWIVSYDLTGQISTANLLPSEQFVLTGYNAVRGFEERILNVDNAALVNISIETPHVSPSKGFGQTKRSEDELYFLLFFDCGIGGNHIRYSGESERKTLGSVGPGIRYQFSRYVTARLDYGYQLWHSGFYNPSHSRYNFGLIVSY